MTDREHRDTPTSRRVSSTQREQVPEQVSPRANDSTTGRATDSTAELGAEGGSYGDLTQSVRAERESAGGRQATWRYMAMALVAVLIVVAVFVAMTFWTPAA